MGSVSGKLVPNSHAPASPDAPPSSLQVFVTLRCNGFCGFCFNSGLVERPDMDVSAFRRLLEAAKGAGVSEIDVLGGEPTLHPGFMDMLDSVSLSGLRANMSSNGLRPGLLRQAAESFGTERVRIGVSLNGDGVAPDLDGFIRAFKPRVKSVYPGRVPPAAGPYIKDPDTEYYLLYMDAVSSGTLGLTVPFGEYYAALERLRAAHENVGGVHCGFLMEEGLEGVRCPAGTTKLSVLPDGSVFPCYLLFRHESFRLGNVFRDDLASLMRSPVLDYFRRFRGNPCPSTRCPHRGVCHGGCPAVSLLIFGDPDRPDPRCRASDDH